MSTTTTVTATFALGSAGPRVDVDANGQYGSATDALMIVRKLFGLTGTALVSGALGPGATRTDPNIVVQHLTNIAPLLDVDANGEADALTDGLMLIRYLNGLRVRPHRRCSWRACQTHRSN